MHLGKPSTISPRAKSPGTRSLELAAILTLFLFLKNEYGSFPIACPEKFMSEK